MNFISPWRQQTQNTQTYKAKQEKKNKNMYVFILQQDNIHATINVKNILKKKYTKFGR